MHARYKKQQPPGNNRGLHVGSIEFFCCLKQITGSCNNQLIHQRWSVQHPQPQVNHF